MESEKEKKYRLERDNWKRKFRKQQRWTETMVRHNDRLKNANVALDGALESIRAKLQAICPHEEPKQVVGNLHYCAYCNKTIVKGIEL
jgi:hypothetical protein